MVEPEAILVIVLEEPEAVEHRCLAQVEIECFDQIQVEPRRRQKTAPAADPISLGDVLDLGKVEMSALMRFDLQPERRMTGVQFVVRSPHHPICAVQGIGAQRQAVRLRTPDPEQCDHVSELIDFVVSKPESPRGFNRFKVVRIVRPNSSSAGMRPLVECRIVRYRWRNLKISARTSILFPT